MENLKKLFEKSIQYEDENLEAYNKGASDAFELLQKDIDSLKDLLSLKDEYIKFLGKELGNNSSFLYAHGITCPEEVITEGESFRNSMKAIERELKLNEILK